MLTASKIHHSVHVQASVKQMLNGGLLGLIRVKLKMLLKRKVDSKKHPTAVLSVLVTMSNSLTTPHL